MELKLDADRLVKGGQTIPLAVKVLRMPYQTLGKWLRFSASGILTGAGDSPVSAEQMELARLRADNARLKMEINFLGKATAYFAKLLR